MQDALNMRDRVVIVTGGTRGVGRGIATRFLQAGAEVIVCGRSAPQDLPAAKNRQASFSALDVRDSAAVGAFVEQVAQQHGHIDVLVNNAGGSPRADSATASPRFAEAIVRLNLLAPLYCAQAVNHVMQRQEGGGVIINIASVSATRPSPGTSAYGAAKAGLVNLGASLAVEWAPRVRVNTVTAGLTLTESAHLHYGDEEGVRAVAATIPLQRLAVPEDIGHACLFLASPLAAYISGSNLLVHGGGEKPAYLDAAN